MEKGTGKSGSRELLSGVKEPKSEEEKSHMLNAAEALSRIDTGAIHQDPASVEKTLSRLRELHGELSAGDRKNELPWYKRTPVALGAVSAAVAVVVVAVVFLVLSLGPQPEQVGTFVSVKGRISVTDRSGALSFASAGDSLEVMQDSVVQTQEDSRAILYLEGDSEIRMDSSTTLAVSMPGEDRVVADIYRGNAYQRIQEGQEYGLGVEGLDIYGSGCAFNTEMGYREVTVLVTDGEVQLSDSVQDVTCEAGQKVVASKPLVTARLSITSAAPEDLDNEWLAWNIEQDERSGFDTFMFPEEPTEQPVEQTEQPEAEEPPPDEPSDRPTPVFPSVQLGGEAGAVENLLNWTVSGYTGSGQLVMLRNQSGDCSYPADIYQVLDFADGGFGDSNIVGGETYFYRVAVIESGQVVSLSNTIQLTPPRDLDVEFSAALDGGTVVLSWNWSANYDVGVTSVELVKKDADGESSRLFPAGSTGYTDNDISAGNTYYYRLYLLSGSERITGGQEQKVVVPGNGG